MSTAETEKSDWPIGDLEPVLGDLKATVGILGHMFNEHQSVELSEWHRIEDELLRLTKRADEIWQQAWDHNTAGEVAHEATLAAVKSELTAEKARHSVPGSAADIEHAQFCWRMVRGAAEIALRECEKSDPHARSPSKKKRRGKAKA